ncbi:MAG: hypothetical protein CVV47_09845 [Spirochaetae bacterium HGW-Spirochaetae-3]|jgi:pyridoxamine 5'-phosphate oxidase|nr:MAG: hypothetical protein CVV47_09845 [Spirochaetae bacterium HGW-Spirochaetae-3]
MNQESESAVRGLIDSARVGVLATVGSDGYPHTRWMTAVTLPGEKDFVYCVSMAGSRKAADIAFSDRVAWSFQAPDLSRVATIAGRAAIIETPELKARVLEALGRDLETFWRVNPDPSRLVVIETLIESAALYRPNAAAPDTEESL